VKRAFAAMRGRRRSREDKAISGATYPDPFAWTEAIDARGAYTGPVLSVDDVLKQGLQHKAMWLHVLSSDSQLLLHRLPSATSTCIVRSQHVRRETDEHCARRAIREELCRNQAPRPNWIMPRLA
jgi:crotonobetainyl-CoA:carnitine CoA-transferase CaiB-like acyl-CoA transferase